MKLVAVVSIIWDIYLRYSGHRKGAAILSEKLSVSIEHRYYYLLWGDLTQVHMVKRDDSGGLNIGKMVIKVCRSGLRNCFV